MLQRIREACDSGDFVLSYVVEFGETYIGGKERNKHAGKKLKAGWGPVGKQAVLGMRERGRKVVAKPVPDIYRDTLQGALKTHVALGSAVHTDEHAAHKGLEGCSHGSVKHSSGEYVGPGDIHVNGQESVWAVLKWSIHSTGYHVSHKHLDRHVEESAFRLSEGNCQNDTLDRMTMLARNVGGNRISYAELIA